MLKAMVPKPTATKRRTAWPEWLKVAQAVWKVTGVSGVGRRRSRDSCFHSAVTLRIKVTTAAPWITWISRPGE